MKAGGEKPWKVGLAVGLALMALVLLTRALLFTGAPTAASGAAPAAVPGPQQQAAQPPRTTRSAARRQQRPAPAVAAPSLDPTLRLDLLRASEGTSYAGRGRNIFRAQPDPEPVRETEPAPQREPERAPVGPPPPPPIPLKFFGFASRQGEPQRVFLAEGETVYIATEGEIVGRRYRVVRIGTSWVEIEDMLNNRRQTIPLTQG